MTIKRIFSDMDGTLLNSEGRVSSGNSKAIRDAQIPLTLVSARAPMEMREAIEELQLTGPQVAFNGGLIYQLVEGKVKPLHTDILPRKTAQTILQAVRKHFPHISISYYDMTHWYCDTIDEGIRLEYSITRQTPTLQNKDEFLAVKDNTFKIMMIALDNNDLLFFGKIFTITGLG